MKYFLFPTACALFLLCSCGKKTGTPPPLVRPVTAARATTLDVPLYLDEIGNCTAFETVMIQPQVAGPITGIRFSDGADVNKGDLLFTIVNFSRFLGANPEDSLRKATNKFIERFKKIEDAVKLSARKWQEFTAEELDKLWQQAKVQ